MAIIRSGVLGNTRGKVAGVVGSQWKDKNYLREYVKPANPNTAAQIVQRDLMKNCVEFCKPLVGPIFNAYTDRFRKSMSGFNYFIKQNIAEFVAVPTLANVSISDGKLSPIANLAANYEDTVGAMAVTWDANNGNNGADTDKTFWVIYDKSTGIWYVDAEETTRSTEMDTETLPVGLTFGNLNMWMMVAQYKGSIVDMISNSVHCVLTEGS